MTAYHACFLHELELAANTEKFTQKGYGRTNDYYQAYD